jgi:hypothetical protein
MKLFSNNKIDIKPKFCPEDFEMHLITDIVNKHLFIKGFKCERIFGGVNIETQLILAMKNFTEEDKEHKNNDVVVFIKQNAGEYYVEFTELYSAYYSGEHDRSIYRILSIIKNCHDGNILFYDEDYYCDKDLEKEYGII